MKACGSMAKPPESVGGMLVLYTQQKYSFENN